MDKIISLINEYSLRVFKQEPRRVSHTYGNYYMGTLGNYTTVYYTVVDGTVVDAMID